MAESWSLLEDERILDGSEAVALVRANLEAGTLTTYLASDRGRLLTLVSNGDRAMVVLMDGSGDPGEHAVSPGATGSSDGYVLDNGQVDTYDDADTVPLADALEAVCAIVDTGRPLADAQWTSDR